MDRGLVERVAVALHGSELAFCLENVALRLLPGQREDSSLAVTRPLAHELVIVTVFHPLYFIMLVLEPLVDLGQLHSHFDPINLVVVEYF